MYSGRRKSPLAPTPYRPQPVPRVLQKKSAAHQSAPKVAVVQPKTPAAPPVYRPQPLPHVLQRKVLKPGGPPVQKVAPPNKSGRGAGPRTPPTPSAVLQRQRQTAPHRHVNARPNGAIQLQKKDAQAYADSNGIAITATHQTVTTYVNNTGNDLTLRKGLLAAWNLNSASNWIIPEPADFSASPYHYSQWGVYQNWTNTTSGVTFTTPFGTGNVSACHKRGAPKLGSDAKQWGKVKLGDSYDEYVRGLRSGGLNDRQIATALLNEDDSAFASQLEKRAAAMIFATVYLAEEWRKQGAAKIYRAMLRAIAAGTRTFDHFKNDYAFIPSAQDGRELVGRFQDVFNNDMDVTDLSATEQVYYGCLSPVHEDDFSSDDDMRTDDKKNLKGTRLFAQKHNTT